MRTEGGGGGIHLVLHSSSGSNTTQPTSQPRQRAYLLPHTTTRMRLHTCVTGGQKKSLCLSAITPSDVAGTRKTWSMEVGREEEEVCTFTDTVKYKKIERLPSILSLTSVYILFNIPPN